MLTENRREELRQVAEEEAKRLVETGEIEKLIFEYSCTLTINQVIEFLNEALALDPEAVTALVDQRVPCNAALAAHPTIQTFERATEDQSILKVGVLGLINGLLDRLMGIREDGWGRVSAVHENVDGRIVRFEETRSHVIERQA